MNIKNIHNPSQISVVVSKMSSILDQCRILAFPSTLFFLGERFISHTITNINVIDRDTCEYSCYLNHNCVSVNFYFGPSEAGIQNCEPNNSTSKEHDKDLVIYNFTRLLIISVQRKLMDVMLMLYAIIPRYHLSVNARLVMLEMVKMLT